MIEILKSPLSQIELEELFPSSLQNLLQELAFEFEGDRQQLLSNRSERQKAYDLGTTPRFEYNHVAKVSDWKVAPIPKDLQDRRVEITGPINSPKMVINMLSANGDGDLACTAMLDFEDSMAPTWENVLAGIQNIKAVAQKNIEFQQDAKVYKLDPKNMAHPMVRRKKCFD
jgi:malate synthase